MEKILKSIDEDEFKNSIKIRFNNILDGFNNYSNGLLEYSKQKDSFKTKEECFIKFFNEALEINNGEAIVDLYIKNLDKDSLDNLLKNLEEGDKNILIKNINKEIKSVYFKVFSKELMSFITRLNTRELFFCTIYFMKYPMTIWGNYNLSFPIFFKESDELEVYKNISKRYNLGIKEVVIK